MSGPRCLTPPLRQPGSPALGGLLSGALLAACTSQIGLGPLCFVALVPLLVALDRAPRAAPAFRAGSLCGAVLFGCALSWVPLAGYRGPGLMLLAVYVALLALGVGGVCALLAALRRHDRALFLAAAPVLWVGFELLRSLGSLGYPWHMLGYALADFPTLIQLAAFAGVFGLSLWIVAVNTALVGLWRTTRPLAGAVALLLLSPAGLGVRALSEPEPGQRLRLAAVQPSIVRPGRASSEDFRANLRVLLDLTAASGDSRPDLIVWPESAFERTVTAGREPLLSSIAHHYGTPLLTGAWRSDEHGSKTLYNSAIIARPDGEILVASDKVNPVAFYESRPASALEQWLARTVLWPGHFERGNVPRPLSLLTDAHGEVLLGVLVCVDTSYPDLSRALRRAGARVLIEISNEAQITSWGAVQHAHVSRLRAVETGAPLLRVANTGPSEWVDARGRVVANMASGHTGVRTVEIALAGPVAPYVWLGDGPVFWAGAAPPLFILLRRRLSKEIPHD